MTFRAFDNQSQSLAIGDLTIENRLDQLTIYGNIDITRDKIGLKNALALKKILDEAIQRLTEDKNLPEQITQLTTTLIDNPFH